ncbi:replication initiation protein [Stenotrophomonas maltophilia]|uniref:replication initiation protein n=1 Tax=Stenotrophomonas maltophilia TaxID=40324 RepID=UPI000B4DD92F|nr:replication initiation protein [Stenotrophomonas maltophilia]OWQ61257.1 hypothetical protein CEE58_15620 [Stenotrophomonas maltophilia]
MSHHPVMTGQSLQRGIATLRQRRRAPADETQGELVGFSATEIGTNLPPRVRLKKAAQAVSIGNVLTAQQRKVWNVLLINAYDELPNKAVSVHRIPMAELMLLIGYNSNNTRALKTSMRELMTKPLEWNVIDERGLDDWEATTALASVKFSGGICQYEFSSMLREKLYHPERFANIDVIEMQPLTLRSSVALYELMARYSRLGSTPWLTIDTWQALFGARTKAYADFRRFREKIINPAVEQVNQETSYVPELEVQTHQRKVVQMRFLISQNDSRVLPGAKENRDEVGTPAPSEVLSDLGQRLVSEMTLTAQQAREVCVAWDENKITAVLDYVADKFSKGEVKAAKIAPYFLSVIKKWADPKESSLVKANAQVKQAVKAEERAQAQAQARINDFSPTIRSVAQRYFLTLSEERQAEIQSAFESYLEADGNPLLARWRKSKNDQVCQALFRNYMVDHVWPVSREQVQQAYLESDTPPNVFAEKLLSELVEHRLDSLTP